MHGASSRREQQQDLRVLISLDGPRECLLLSAQEVSVLRAKRVAWTCNADWGDKFHSFRKCLPPPNINWFAQLPGKHGHDLLIGSLSWVRKT